MRKCFNCGKEINKRNGRHIYWCCRNKEISKEQIRFKQICFESNKEWTKTDFKKAYITDGLSLPDFQNKFGLVYSETKFLIRFFGLKQRSIKEANAAPQRSAKHKNTCQERYGQENVSQVDGVKAKKQATFLKNYGVDNIWKLPAYYDWLHDHMIAKYGKASLPNRFGNKTKWWSEQDEDYRKEFGSKITEGLKEFWTNLPEEAKEEWVEVRRSFWRNLSDEEKTSRMKKVLQGQNYTSKQEGRIAEILTTLDLGYKRHLWLAGLNFDFKIEGYGKTILEYNGNYWHANPLFYKKDDLIRYPNESKTAQQVWQRDEYKKEIAQKYGYRVVYIWEEESKNLKDFELGKLIIDRLENIHEDQENSKD